MAASPLQGINVPTGIGIAASAGGQTIQGVRLPPGFGVSPGGFQHVTVPGAFGFGPRPVTNAGAFVGHILPAISAPVFAHFRNPFADAGALHGPQDQNVKRQVNRVYKGNN